MDAWKTVWDWAKQVWGDNSDYSFEAFFRRQAQRRAEAEGWQELGSSDVWHACFEAVKSALMGKVITNRAELEKAVREYMS